MTRKERKRINREIESSLRFANQIGMNVDEWAKLEMARILQGIGNSEEKANELAEKILRMN